MENFKIIKIIFFLLCLSVLNIYGQRNEISKTEFSAVHEKPAENSGKLSRRVVSEGYIYDSSGAKLREIKKEVYETESPNRWRLSMESKNFDFDITSTFEVIMFDGIEYQRENGGEWTQKKVEKPQNTIGKTAEKSVKYFITKNVSVENRIADLVEIESKIVYQAVDYKTKAVSDYAVQRTQKYWISGDLIIKSEIIIENGETNKPTLRHTSIYQYDPNIKIEAPMIKDSKSSEKQLNK